MSKRNEGDTSRTTGFDCVFQGDKGNVSEELKFLGRIKDCVIGLT